MPVHCAPREGGALRSRGVAQSGSAPALGAGCRGFESLHPDHISSAKPQRVWKKPSGLSLGDLPELDLMVAVAHQVEHRIVAPEVAGSRPVSHPIHLEASLRGEGVFYLPARHGICDISLAASGCNTA